MLHRPAQLRTTLLATADFAALALALVIAYLLRFRSGLFAVNEAWTPVRYLLALPPAVLLGLASFAAADAYRPPRTGRDPELRIAVGGVLAAALLLTSGALLYRDRYQFSRGVLVIFPFVAAPLVFLARALAVGLLQALRKRGIGVRRVLLAGTGPRAEQVESVLAAQPWVGLEIAEQVETADEIPAALARKTVEEVLLVFPVADSAELAEAARLLATEMVDVRVIPDLPGPGARDAALLGGLPVVTLQATPFYGARRVLKRAFDLLAGSVLLVLALPVTVVLALLVLIFTGRPILYRQERMGLDGRRFQILKFRTMRRDAEKETGAVWARANDPRCTGVGRWLRRFSLDELPQILNVLRGDMSLVGPRPERPVLIEEFRKELPGYMLRHRIPAGLTGWAQIHGQRGDSDPAERLRCDLDYLERWSLLFDVEILLRTVWHVLRGRNAV